MPTYEYECRSCAHRFEVFQKMTDQPIDKCPACGGKVDRLISAGSGIIFKGKGFYETDYKKKSKSSRDKDNKPPTCPNADKCEGCK